MKRYASFDEFNREELRPLNRVGFSTDEFDIDNNFQDDSFLFDSKDSDDDEEE